MGKNRWALSGTPIANSLMEFYPCEFKLCPCQPKAGQYLELDQKLLTNMSDFKFLQIQHTGTAKIFKKNFYGNGSDLYNQRLHAFLDHIMIRRAYTDELMGRRLVTLPKFSQNVRKVQLNTTERLFYEIITLRFVRAINIAAKEEGEAAKKEMIIRRLLRLRQITSHVAMLQDYFERIFTVSLQPAKTRLLADTPSTSGDRYR